MNTLLVRRFPAAIDGYFAIKRLWAGEEPGPHIVYGDIFVPLVRAALNGTSNAELRAAMDFLEELSETGDVVVLEVVVTTILESLLDAPGRVRLESSMGPRTLKLWKRLLADAG